MRALIEKRSKGSRCTALGFAALIFFGNFWLVYKLLGRPAPQFIIYLLEASTFLVIIGGLVMLGEQLINMWKKNDNQD